MQPKKLADDLADIARANQQSRDAALLRATTELFIMDLTHDGAEIRRYEELAPHFLPKVAVADRIFVAERIAACADAPRSVVRTLARDAIEVAAPVIRRAPSLDAFDLLAIIAATGVEHHRLVARRSELPDDVKRALRLTGDSETIGYLDNGSAIRVVAPSAPVPEPVKAAEPIVHRPPAQRDPFDAWQFLKLDRPTRLRLLADIAMRPPMRRQAGSATLIDRAFRSILSAAQIVGFARTGKNAELVAAIADGLEIETAAVAAAVSDPTGEALAVFLKALRLDDIQAQQVFLLASPVGRDVQAFFPLTDLFAGMEASTAETLCEAWRLAATERKTRHEPHLAENGDRRRTGAAIEAARPPVALPQEQARRA
ncbi:DUF2336 domain-containing protein [soil metagenome]